MEHINEVIRSVQACLDDECTNYVDIIMRASKQIPPVFFTSTYKDFLWHCAASIPNWLPKVVVACANTEGHGAHELLKIWSSVNFHAEAESGLLHHARDEAGHAKLFVKLAKLVFAENFATDSLDQLENSLRPIVSADLHKTSDIISESMLIDYLMQLNIVEIRTRHHLHILAPMYYALAPQNNKRKVEQILNGLSVDETSHVVYTARLINGFASKTDMDRLAGVYACRLQNYNQHTLDHSDYTKNNYGQGEFPALFNLENSPRQ